MYKKCFSFVCLYYAATKLLPGQTIGGVERLQGKIFFSTEKKKEKRDELSRARAEQTQLGMPIGS